MCHGEYFRDPSLFSLIDSVWSGTKGAVSSQDRETGTPDNCRVCSCCNLPIIHRCNGSNKGLQYMLLFLDLAKVILN